MPHEHGHGLPVTGKEKFDIGKAKNVTKTVLDKIKVAKKTLTDKDNKVISSENVMLKPTTIKIALKNGGVVSELSKAFKKYRETPKGY
tara:strand:+ start:583 stop:846 length:264 start_codon:yes stop_codon:yes gene_type:complete